MPQPTVFSDNEVAIKVSLEVSNIVDKVQTKSGSLAYQIGTRNASTLLKLKDGENQVLAGLIRNDEISTGNGIPFLSDIPGLGRLFGSRLDNANKSEIILSITPRIIRNAHRSELTDTEFDTGTEAKIWMRTPENPLGTMSAQRANTPVVQLSNTLTPPDSVQSVATPPATNLPHSSATGFSYVGLLIMIAIVGAMAAGAFSAGAMMQRRMAEEELLFVGSQFHKAIKTYYESSPKGSQPYPNQLSDLVLDPRFTGTRRHLRKIFNDPLTGKAEWGLMQAPSGGIMGIYSLSPERPIKTSGFDTEFAAFESKISYSEWGFAYIPASTGESAAY